MAGRLRAADLEACTNSPPHGRAHRSAGARLLQWQPATAAAPTPTRLRGGGAAHPQLLHLRLEREPHLQA